MSELTSLNRWKRYQIARLQGLIGGLKDEADRLRNRDMALAIDALGTEMVAELHAHCNRLRNDIKNGHKNKVPALEYERL